MKGVIWFLVILLFLSSLAPRAHADYSITVSKDGAKVAVSTILIQNVSVIQPQFSFKYVLSNSSSLQNSFNIAAKSLTPGATIRNLSMNGSSDGASIHVSLVYQINGISTEEQGILGAGTFDINLAWRALAVRDNIVLNGDSVNLVGSAYYVFPLQQLTNRTVGGRGTATTFLNGENHPANVIVNATQNFAVLDFSFLNTPLDTWQQSFDLAAQTTTWRTTAGFNVTVLSTFQEPSGGLRFSKAVILYLTNAQIVAPGLAVPGGNRVRIDTGNATVLIAIGIILASAGLLALGFFSERRILSSARPRSRKPKKSGSR